MMKETLYRIETARENVHLRAAVAADLHGRDGKDALRIIEGMKPDVILVPGDLSNRFCQPPDTLSIPEWNAYRKGMGFLRSAAELAPVYYSLGNHEMGGIHSGRPWAQKHFPPYAPIHESIRKEITSIGVTLLDDAYAMHGNVAIGGLTSALTYSDRKPNHAFLSEFEAVDAYKLLLCHHPEYYPAYLCERSIDLTVAGHAHGGQWSFFGQAIYAPGQGLFPKLVRGVHDGRLAISRGMTNNAWVPRIFVPREVLCLEIVSRQG